MFNNQQEYGSGCNFGTFAPLLKGVLDVVGSAEFDQLMAQPQSMIYDKALSAKLLALDRQVSALDWVPGDKGYILGSGPTGISAGQYVIAVGYGMLWGFGAGPGGTTSEIHSLEDWLKIEKGGLRPYRYYPGVGLDVRYGNQ
jgi:hypothetical protein